MRSRGEDAREPRSAAITPSAAVLLVGAIHAVRISIAAPAHRDAVPVLTLELVELAAWRAVFLQGQGEGQQSAGTAPAATASHPASAPQDQALSPSWGWGTPGSSSVPSPTRGEGEGAGREPLLSVLYLVRAIRTVVVPIALPPAGDAAAVGTGELALGAGSGCWGHRTEGSQGRRLQAGLRGQKVSLANSLGGAQADTDTHPVALGTGWVQAEPGELPERGTADTSSQPPSHPTPGLPSSCGEMGFSGGTMDIQTHFWQCPTTLVPQAVLH